MKFEGYTERQRAAPAEAEPILLCYATTATGVQLTGSGERTQR